MSSSGVVGERRQEVGLSVWVDEDLGTKRMVRCAFHNGASRRVSG